MLVELFSISRLQRASSESVRAVLVRFVSVRNCITSGIVCSRNGSDYGRTRTYMAYMQAAG